MSPCSLTIIIMLFLLKGLRVAPQAVVPTLIELYIFLRPTIPLIHSIEIWVPYACGYLGDCQVIWAWHSFNTSQKRVWMHEFYSCLFRRQSEKSSKAINKIKYGRFRRWHCDPTWKFSAEHLQFRHHRDGVFSDKKHKAQSQDRKSWGGVGGWLTPQSLKSAVMSGKT